MILAKVERRLLRLSRVCSHWIWLRRQGPAQATTGVFIVGAQRSGTTMLTDCFENSPEFDVYGETSIAFENSILKSLNTASALIQSSKRPFVAFKPLTDSHRVSALLSVAGSTRAIWMYRGPDDRANSAVARFGDTNLRFVREVVNKGLTDRWEARGLDAERVSMLRRFDPKTLDPHSAAGLFWYLRNQLFFDQGLDRNPNVLLLKYEMFVLDPEPVMRAVCDFVGCEYRSGMIRHIHSQSIGRYPVELSSEVAKLCYEMLASLDGALVRQWNSMGVPIEPTQRGLANVAA